jgi:hypothetical protein
MDFYDDNNNIYYEKKPCLERFTHISKSNRNFGLGCSKTIINNFHKDILELNILSPHTCLDPAKHDFRKLELNTNDAKLKHFFTKSLEEWISKMDYNIDADYFRRWRGRIFKEYFQWNTITPEKIKAIDTLLLKYNINYDIIGEECISPFLQSYKNITNKDYKNVACISVIDNDNIDNIDNWINENHNVGINKFFIGYYNEKLNLPKYDFVEYIKLNDTLDLADMYNVLLKTVKNVKYHYILSLETNNFINIKTGDNDISSILNKHFPGINSSIQIEVDDCSNNCKICINNHHIDAVKINMLSKNTCSGYIDGFKIPSDILTIKTNV